MESIPSCVLSPIEARYFYDRCHHQIACASDRSPHWRLWQCKQLFDELSLHLCRLHTAGSFFFYSFYERLDYLTQAYQLPTVWQQYISNIKQLLLKVHIAAPVTENEWQLACKLFYEFVWLFSGVKPPNSHLEARAHVTDNALHSASDNTKPYSFKVFPILFLYYEKQDNHNILCYGIHETYGEICLHVRPVTHQYRTFSWQANLRYLEAHQLLHFTDIVYFNQTWHTTDTSLLIVEPDYLFDVSALVASMQAKKILPALYLIRRYLSSGISYPAFLGNLINDIFDLYAFQTQHTQKTSDTEPITLLNKALQNRAVEWLSLLMQTYKEDLHASVIEKEKTKINYEIQSHLENIKKLFQYYQNKSCITEASFISPFYGLQGRVDLLVETKPNQSHHIELIELKSGRAPVQEVWQNHLQQIAGYDLLLRDTLPKYKSKYFIFYSGTKQPLRQCEGLLLHQQQLLLLRNSIVTYERRLCKADMGFFDRILEKLEHASLPEFLQIPITDFYRTWKQASILDKAYFTAHSAFIARESRLAKLGGSTAHTTAEGFASLWRCPTALKQEQLTCLIHYTPRSWCSQSGELVLEDQNESTQHASFRAGDIVLLYPSSQHEQKTRYPILRGTIIDIQNKQIRIQLRHRFVSPSFFKEILAWNIEADWIESQTNTFFQGLYHFIKAPAARRAILYGIERPSFTDTATLLQQIHQRYSTLSQTQQVQLARALAAKDYYLLQGPPGTGKTSALLTNIVDFIFKEQPEQHVVVVAFTNRATDEIAHRLHHARIPFIRLGQVYDEKLAAYRLHQPNHSIQQLKQRLDTCRVWLSTVSSFHRYQHLVPRIDTLIVDEASQLLEIHLCGLLVQAKRFILIGDERQLPAVTLQEADKNFENQSTKILKENGLYPLHLSVFERLLYNAQKKGWQEAYGMLEEHFRCHEEVMQTFNQLFYKRLRTATPWQSKPLPTRKLGLLDQSRLLYLPTQQEKARSKIHLQEAELVAILIEQLLRYYPSQSLGVITPFRSQIAAIRALSLVPDSVVVDTVERFQGSERDVIIMSTCLNNEQDLNSIQSFDLYGYTDRKLNVALSRAREQFILLGVEDILCQAPLYRRLIEEFFTKVDIDNLKNNQRY